MDDSADSTSLGGWVRLFERAENAEDSDAKEGDPEFGKFRHRSPSCGLYSCRERRAVIRSW